MDSAPLKKGRTFAPLCCSRWNLPTLTSGKSWEGKFPSGKREMGEEIRDAIRRVSNASVVIQVNPGVGLCQIQGSVVRSVFNLSFTGDESPVGMPNSSWLPVTRAANGKTKQERQQGQETVQRGKIPNEKQENQLEEAETTGEFLPENRPDAQRERAQNTQRQTAFGVRLQHRQPLKPTKKPTRNRGGTEKRFACNQPEINALENT